jgi:CPA1 family monovalent cation:H+ antiporter
VIRPVSVLVSTLRSELSLRERIFLCFLAPRGIVAAAVASVFALKLATLDSLPGQLATETQQLVPLTFLVIVGTVSVYGLLAGPLARRLDLADPNPQGVLIAGADPWTRDIASVLQSEGYAVLLVDTNYTNIAEARMGGLAADCSSILSEHVHDELDLSGIGRLLAMTANDEVNALAVREFAHSFGRANVYQLPLLSGGTSRRVSVSQHLRGRLLFGEHLHHDELGRRVRDGAVVKKTQLTESFTYDEFLELYGESAVLLFLIDEGKQLQVCTADSQVAPRPGHTVIALVDAPASRPNDAPAD